jgi:DNA-binding transcriptional LysR family regulator
VRETGSGTRAVLEQLLVRDGLSLDALPIFLVLPSNEAVREAVEAGAGATVISEHVVARDLAAGLLKSIPIDLPPREFALVRHRDRHQSAAQQALADELRERPVSAAAAGPARSVSAGRRTAKPH